MSTWSFEDDMRLKNRGLWRSKEDADLEVKCQGYVWKVHRTVMKSQSRYFKELIETKLQPSGISVLKFETEEPVFVGLLLKAIYGYDIQELLATHPLREADTFEFERIGLKRARTKSYHGSPIPDMMKGDFVPTEVKVGFSRNNTRNERMRLIVALHEWAVTYTVPSLESAIVNAVYQFHTSSPLWGVSQQQLASIWYWIYARCSVSGPGLRNIVKEFIVTSASTPFAVKGKAFRSLAQTSQDFAADMLDCILLPKGTNLDDEEPLWTPARAHDYHQASRRALKEETSWGCRFCQTRVCGCNVDERCRDCVPSPFQAQDELCEGQCSPKKVHKDGWVTPDGWKAHKSSAWDGDGGSWGGVVKDPFPSTNSAGVDMRCPAVSLPSTYFTPRYPRASVGVRGGVNMPCSTDAYEKECHAGKAFHHDGDGHHAGISFDF